MRNPIVWEMLKYLKPLIIKLSNFTWLQPKFFLEYFWLFDGYLIALIVIIIFWRLRNPLISVNDVKKIWKLLIAGLILQVWILNCLIHKSITFKYFEDLFIYSPVIIYVKIFLSILVICFLISTIEYLRYERFCSAEFVILILLCLEGIFLLLSVNDFFVMYLVLELQSLSLYLLASLKRYSNLAVEAGLKYFIYGSFASGILLYGVSWLYGCFGATSFNSIYMSLYILSFENEYVLISVFGFVLILTGLFFKLGIAPFHFWVPDIYDGSPTFITYFFALIPKLAILFILYRAFAFILNPYYMIPYLSYIFIFLFSVCAILSLIFGSIGALYQTKIKRLLAFSAIANLGYILLGLCNLSVFGLFASIYYFFLYSLSIIQIFSILLVIRHYSSYAKIKNLVEFSSLNHANFGLSFLLVLGLLSLAGIPPMAGFFGKIFIFFSLIAEGQYFLALCAVLFSLITCVYYIRLIRFLWFGDTGIAFIYFLVPLTEVQAYFVAFISLFNIFLFIFQGVAISFFYEFTVLLIECL